MESDPVSALHHLWREVTFGHLTDELNIEADTLYEILPEFPSFVIGCLISHIINVDIVANYYNEIICRSIAVGGIVFGFLGLLMLYRFLCRQFSSKVAIWTVFSVMFGTNLFHYITREMSISHVYSFFLFVSLLFYFPLFLARPHIKFSIVLGIILGWIVVVRPTNAFVFILLFGYEVYSAKELYGRFIFFVRNWYYSITIVFFALLMVFPQMLYWREMTGSWIYYSYNREGFWYFANPKILEVLFDVQNGLFLYSPLVFLMIFGIILGIKNKKYSGLTLAVIFIVITYTFASWWTWWFGGAFGHRCYVEYYALFAIPLAGLFQTINDLWKRKYRFLFYGMTIMLMIYSVRLSYLNTTLPGPWDGKDWRWNWEKYEWIMRHFFWPKGLY